MANRAQRHWCQIVPVPNCLLLTLDATLSVLNSWCQIVRFELLVPNCPLLTLGAKLSGAGAKLSSAKLPGAKLSYNRAVLLSLLTQWYIYLHILLDGYVLQKYII